MADSTFWAVFAGIGVAILRVYWFFVLRHETAEQAAFRRRLKYEDPVQAQVRLLKETKALSGIGGLNVLLNQLGGLSKPLGLMIDRSGLPITVGALILICTSSSLLVTLI